MPLAQQRCILRLWLLGNTTKKPYDRRPPSSWSVKEAVADVVSVAFARWWRNDMCPPMSVRRGIPCECCKSTAHTAQNSCGYLIQSSLRCCISFRRHCYCIVSITHSNMEWRHIHTDVGRFWRNGSHRAKTPVDVRLVFLGESVKRAAMKVVPRSFHSDLVVVWNIVHLVEHHRHSRLLPPKSRRLRRRLCTAAHSTHSIKHRKRASITTGLSRCNV